LTLRDLRDRAILASLLYHGSRRAELYALCKSDVHERCGVMHLQVHGKGSNIRYVSLHPAASYDEKTKKNPIAGVFKRFWRKR